jgi:hypothetical protein|tara:strand:+ start:344 stop:535 length:192 start_codon:yes stop_codon:yes gene_type:complete
MDTVIIELFDKPEFKKQLVNAINASINIPLINEDTEENIFNAIYGVILNQIKKSIEYSDSVEI